jgi:hypothetical protein
MSHFSTNLFLTLRSEKVTFLLLETLSPFDFYDMMLCWFSPSFLLPSTSFCCLFGIYLCYSGLFRFPSLYTEHSVWTVLSINWLQLQHILRWSQIYTKLNDWPPNQDIHFIDIFMGTLNSIVQIWINDLLLKFVLTLTFVWIVWNNLLWERCSQALRHILQSSVPAFSHPSIPIIIYYVAEHWAIRLPHVW